MIASQPSCGWVRIRSHRERWLVLKYREATQTGGVNTKKLTETATSELHNRTSRKDKATENAASTGWCRLSEETRKHGCCGTFGHSLHWHGMSYEETNTTGSRPRDLIGLCQPTETLYDTAFYFEEPNPTGSRPSDLIGLCCALSNNSSCTRKQKGQIRYQKC